MIDALVDRLMHCDKPLIITKTSTQRHVLRTLTSRKIFKPIRFMTPQELKATMFFEIDASVLFASATYLKTSPAIARMYLEAMNTVSTEANYEDAMLVQLQKLKQELVKKGLITQQKHRLESFKNHHIIVALDAKDDVVEHAIASLETLAPLERINPQQTINQTVHINTFDDHESEVVFFLEHIRKLLENGTEPETIGIALANPAYESSIRMLFPLFGIPLNFMQAKPLTSIPITRDFLNAFDRSSATNLHDRLDEALEYIKKPDPQVMRIASTIINVINPYIMVEASADTLTPFIHDALTHALVGNQDQHGIAVLPLNKVEGTQFEHLFIFGCTEGHFPAYKIEDDLLSYTAKQTIKRRTAREENTVRKSILLSLIKGTKHVAMGASKTVLSENHHPASFFDMLRHTFNVSPLAKVERIKSTRSKSYDRLFVKKERDRALAYGERFDALEAMHHLFKDDYLPHNNRFTPLSDSTKAMLFPKPLALSYTSLQNYFKCQFRYLMENVLRVDPQSETFAMILGTFIHAALEQYSTSMPSDEELETLLHDILKHYHQPLDAKGMFFIKQSFTPIRRVLKTIQKQLSRSKYTWIDHEKRIRKTFTVDHKPVTFTGVIDAILARKTDDKQKLILLDYKSGNPTLKPLTMLTGINAQLPSYLVLIHEAFRDIPHEVSGFYEQTVLNKMPKRDGDTPLETRIEQSLNWQGITVNDPHEIQLIDSEVEQDAFIQGLKVNQNGSIRATSKVLDQDAIEALAKTFETLIEDAAHAMMQGQFAINPKQANGKDLSCAYCPYKDICYKNAQDYIETSEVFESMSALNDELKQRGGES